VTGTPSYGAKVVAHLPVRFKSGSGTWRPSRSRPFWHPIGDLESHDVTAVAVSRRADRLRSIRHHTSSSARLGVAYPRDLSRGLFAEVEAGCCAYEANEGGKG
jgi:hypothetical protein